MNLHHLAVFHAVVEAGSVSRAAEALSVSQPAVSKQVRELERSLGVTLLDRLPRGVAPTAAGRLLADHARRLFAVEAEAERAVAELKGLRRGSLTVGASTTIAGYLLPAAFARFGRGHPDIDLALHVANTADVLRRLVEGGFDLGFTEGSADALEAEPAVESRVFAHDELVAVLAADHPLAAGRAVDLEEVLEVPLVMREAGSGTRAVLERALVGRNLEATLAMSLGSTEAVMGAVAAGAGAAFISRLAASGGAAAGRLAILPIRDWSLQRPLHLLWLCGRELSRAAEAFVKEIVPKEPGAKATVATARRPRRA